VIPGCEWLKGSETHFKVIVVADEFEGKRLIEVRL
jgi:stress-induced morphogen